ncbi:MAG: hypothetical protein EBX41_08190, partial [Chitinophagia bacterium]|nr:hypothetical protein [Chitinophagia bacterium]
NSTTSFDTAGNVTNFWQQSHDDIHTLVAPPLPKKPDTAPKKEIAKCAEIYVSEGWFINGTKDTVRVNADRIGNIKEHFSELIAPGETKKVLYFILAQQFDDPEKYYSISLVPGKRKKKKLRYELLNKANANPTTKKYVYLVQ